MGADFSEMIKMKITSLVNNTLAKLLIDYDLLNQSCECY